MESTNTPWRYDVFKIQLHYGNSSLHTSTCSAETDDDYMVHISNNHFVGTGLSVGSEKKYNEARVKLKNIAIQNCPKFTALNVRMLSIDLQDLTFV